METSGATASASLSGQSGAVDSASFLVEYQTVMACLSDMSLGSVHEGLQMPPDMPLHSFAAFDQERLSRIARWRSTPRSSKEVSRCYVKVILALAELHGAAAPLKLSPCIARNSATKTNITGPPEPSNAALALPAKTRA